MKKNMFVTVAFLVFVAMNVTAVAQQSNVIWDVPDNVATLYVTKRGHAGEEQCRDFLAGLGKQYKVLSVDKTLTDVVKNRGSESAYTELYLYSVTVVVELKPPAPVKPNMTSNLRDACNLAGIQCDYESRYALYQQILHATGQPMFDYSSYSSRLTKDEACRMNIDNWYAGTAAQNAKLARGISTNAQLFRNGKLSDVDAANWKMVK